MEICLVGLVAVAGRGARAPRCRVAVADALLSPRTVGLRDFSTRLAARLAASRLVVKRPSSS